MRIDVKSSVPLGHKFAVRAITASSPVRKYGVVIGVATADIKQGEYVHVHNVRSARWAKSS